MVSLIGLSEAMNDYGYYNFGVASDHLRWSRSSDLGDRYFLWATWNDGRQNSYYDTIATSSHGVAFHVLHWSRSPQYGGIHDVCYTYLDGHDTPYGTVTAGYGVACMLFVKVEEYTHYEI